MTNKKTPVNARNRPLDRQKSIKGGKKRNIMTPEERITWRNALNRLAGVSPSVLKNGLQQEQYKKNKKSSYDDIDETYLHEDRPVRLAVETSALQAFLKIQSQQIAHLRKRFDTDADLCNACSCTLDDLRNWELFADTVTLRLAGELPRDRLALLLINARAYGVHITQEDILIGLGHKE